MAQTDPSTTTVADLCQAALRECGALGLGQSAVANDVVDAWARLQWMLQQWERKRWFVYHLVELSKVSTGAASYSIGPGGDFDTGAGSARPNRLEAAFLRQLQTNPPNQPDYPLEILQSWEDFAAIPLKQMVSFPGAIFLDTGWPSGTVHVYPVPNSAIYEVHLVVRAQLPAHFAQLTTVLALPYEYYGAMLYNLAERLRPKYRIATFPGDPLPGLARDSRNVLRTGNAQISRLRMPGGALGPRANYNIFSDRF